ncbi:MAG: aromatic amino acid lyase [Jatrophihabitantaceae bacterium]
MIVLDGTGLTTSEIAAVAAGREQLTLAPEARERIAASAAFAEAAARERPIYGRSTGVGANRSVALADDLVGAQALALLRSHATSAGPLRAPERVRAMLVIRLNQLAAGGSGASVAVADGLLELLRLDALPPVRELGSIGTADLSALAVTGLTLIGEIETQTDFRPISMGIGDALPLLSSNAAALADAALALDAVRILARAVVVVSALSFVAVDGNLEAFSVAVERATPFAGARQVCQIVRQLVAGSDHAPARIQDPFGLRALPQVHGALLDRLEELDVVIGAMVNAPSENPVLLPDAGVAHHGGFHAAYLGQALDATALALAQAGELALARVTMFGEPGLTGLAPFLGDGTPGASGVMVIEYVAASALAIVRAAATPAGIQTVTLSRGVEEDASFAALAAAQLLAASPTYRTLLACELVPAVRCLRMRAVEPPAGLVGAFAACAGLATETADRDLTADLLMAESVIGQIMSSSGRNSSA